MGSGHDVYFTDNAGCYAIHTKTREEIDSSQTRKFEIVAEVVLPFHKQVKAGHQVLFFCVFYVGGVAAQEETKINRHQCWSDKLDRSGVWRGKPLSLLHEDTWNICGNFLPCWAA